MNPISAYFNRAISASRNPNKAWYLILVVAALAISGCGEDEKTPAQQLAESAGVPSGATGSSSRAGQGATAGGSTGKTGGANKAEEAPKKNKKPSNPRVQVPNSEKPQTKIDSTEPSRMSVTINLKNGKMAETTPTIVMVPTEIDVDLDVYVEDNQSYTLKVVKAEGRATEAPIFPKKGIYTYSLGPMLDGQVATVKLGKKTIEIKAGAEPGP